MTETGVADAGPTPWQTIPANSDTVTVDGRIDTTDTGLPILIWQGSEVRTEISGNQLQVGFGEVKGQVYFNLSVGDHQSIIKAEQGWQPLTHDLPPDQYPVSLFKRSEASTGNAELLGFRFVPRPQNTDSAQNLDERHYDHQFLFIGDSITVGACNEDGEQDQWTDFITHNNAMSYGALAAKAFNARYRNIAASGAGIVTGYVPYTALDFWDRLYPAPNSPQADLQQYQPDVIFLNFGENDDSYTRNSHSPFPKQFQARYLQLIAQIRRAYPESDIVLLRGGMSGGATSEPLRTAWEDVVSQAQAKDPKVFHYAFKHWSTTHPRVADHQIMAEELKGWLSHHFATRAHNPGNETG